MRIGVLSDTHLAGRDEVLRARLEHHFRGVDLILHAGDLVDLAVLEMLAPTPVQAVRGNSDPHRVRGLLPDRLTLEVGGFRLMLVHDGTRSGSGRTGMTEGPPDCIVSGHTHRPDCRTSGGVLYFNPGSATHNRCLPAATIGLLEIGSGVRGRIIAL